MSLRSQVGNVRRHVLAAVHQRPALLDTNAPIVTFSFDDFPRTALTVGAEILEDFGARATYYVAMSLMNSSNDLGEQFRQEDLPALVDRGHELASHTFSHLSARRVSCDTFVRDAEKGERALQDEIRLPGSGNFAYPYGEATLEAKKRLGPTLTSCRGTCPGLNGPEVDLNLLRANCLYGGLDVADAAKELVLENKEQGRWLIFYSHDVAAQPSPFGCTPQLLEAICSFAASCGAHFMTVAEVMKQLGGKRQTALDATMPYDKTALSGRAVGYSNE
jgi:peptidoglycan/xylan/chitin deacetylase (PgdA/CDA1 family)